MRKNLFFIALLFTGLVACKSKAAFNFSETMVSKEKALSSLLETAEKKIGGYVTASQYDSITISAVEMEKEVQIKIDEINAMPVPKAKEADSFKAAMLRYFNYIKKLYTGYKKFGMAGSDEEREKAATEQDKLVDEKASVLNEIQRVQKKYAEANGFKLQ